MCMGLNIRNIVSTLSLEDRIQIFKDFNKFEKDGYIGDCLLRSISETSGLDQNYLSMNLIAFEVWRTFCVEHLKQILGEQIVFE